MKYNHQGIIDKSGSSRPCKRPFLPLLPLLILPALAQAKCEKFDAPVLPQSAEISTAEMAEVQQKVEAYMTQAKRFLNCTKRKKKRNEAIDEMRAVAAEYNVLIVLYREAQAAQQQ